MKKLTLLITLLLLSAKFATATGTPEPLNLTPELAILGDDAEGVASISIGNIAENQNMVVRIGTHGSNCMHPLHGHDENDYFVLQEIFFDAPFTNVFPVCAWHEGYMEDMSCVFVLYDPSQPSTPPPANGVRIGTYAVTNFCLLGESVYLPIMTVR